MIIAITLEVDDDEADASHSTGLTNDAYDELISALSRYTIVDGPEPVAWGGKGIPL